jgi:hypothetical protein
VATITTRALLSFIVGVAGVAPVFAQAPDFSGTWRLDRSISRVDPSAAFAGLIASGAPDTLHITQPANGTLIIESQINEGHSRLYRPGGQTSTPAGQGGSVTMTSRWESRALVSEGRQELPSGASAAVREVIALTADGNALTIEITTTVAAGKSVSTLTYTRTRDVGPCGSWPTPCKPPPPADGFGEPGPPSPQGGFGGPGREEGQHELARR